jgi:AcrR family transcriptional regulator
MSEPATAIPTRRKRVSALPPDERRSMIVEAAVPLVLEYGDRVTSRQIAEAAGIAEGTIFRAFTDKDEVIEAVVEAVLDPAPLEAKLRGLLDDRTLEQSLAAAFALSQQRIFDVWRVLASVGLRHREKFRKPITDSEGLVAIFERHADELTVAPVVAARLFRALTLSTTHPMLCVEPMTADEVIETFLHGVGATKGASC